MVEKKAFRHRAQHRARPSDRWHLGSPRPFGQFDLSAESMVVCKHQEGPDHGQPSRQPGEFEQEPISAPRDYAFGESPSAASGLNEVLGTGHLPPPSALLSMVTDYAPEAPAIIDPARPREVLRLLATERETMLPAMLASPNQEIGIQARGECVDELIAPYGHEDAHFLIDWKLVTGASRTRSF
jgi:hypothetical protein